MPAPVDLTPLIRVLISNIGPMTVAILAVAAAFISVAITSVAVYMLIGTIKGQKFVAGRFWDYDVYEAAMRDLHRQKRGGILLDAESNRALREYQGYGRRR